MSKFCSRAIIFFALVFFWQAILLLAPVKTLRRVSTYIHSQATSSFVTWNTFLGGSLYGYGNAMAVDTSGNIYVAGMSDTTWGSPVKPYAGGGYDAFAAKLDGSGA
jgi:hypothetical protein